MTKEDLRVKFLSEIPNRITNNDNRNYSEWLEDLLVKKDICDCQNKDRNFIGSGTALCSCGKYYNLGE